MATEPDSVEPDPPSLESLVETGMLPLESLHPGGLVLTRQLADLCGISAGSQVLDVACGTGESAFFLAESMGARVVGVDHSPDMIERARSKSRSRGMDLQLLQADAASLPLADGAFDAVLCECTLCFLDKPRVLREMSRVVKPGGWVGMHDLCWQPHASERLKQALSRLEGEEPETVAEWQRLFQEAGLTDIHTADKSALKARWMHDSRRQLGIAGQAGLAMGVYRRWGVHGLWTILRSERVFSNRQLGYVLMAGMKPARG